MNCLRLLAVFVSAAGACVAGRTQEPAPRSAYPRDNTAVAFVVDPDWPKRRDSVPWAAVPGIAVDAQDRVWLATRTVAPVQLYDARGNFVRSWGGDAIRPRGPHHLRVDREGNVWLADMADHVVRKFDAEGKVLLTLGVRGKSGWDAVHLNRPTDMAVTKDGHVFVADGYANARIAHFDPAGRFVKEWGGLGSGPGQFSIPHSIVVDSKDRLYVADRNNARIQVFDREGRFLDQWLNLIVPWGLWMTPADELWVCGSSPAQWKEGGNHLGVPPRDQLFMKFNAEGKVMQLWSVPKGADGAEAAGDLNWVHCIAVDSRGNIYAGDINGRRAQKFRRVDPERDR